MSGLVVNEASAPATPSTPVVGNFAGANEGRVLKRPRGRPYGPRNKPKPVGDNSAVKGSGVKRPPGHPAGSITKSKPVGDDLGEGSVVQRKRGNKIPIDHLTIQCATCFKWRVVPLMEIYEEIKTHLEEEPFFCDVACQWKPEMSCEVPADISQEGTEYIWALESHLIPRPRAGWRRLTHIRGEGGLRFADMYLKENPRYIIEGMKVKAQVKKDFSFKIPKPLQTDYVRKRPARKMNPSGNSNAIVATGEGPSASRSPNTCLAIQIYQPPEASRSPYEHLALVIYQPPEEPQLHASPDEQCLAIQLYVPPEQPELHASPDEQCLAIQLYVPPEQPELHASASKSPEEEAQLLPDVPPQPEPELHASASRYPIEQLELPLDVPPEPEFHAWASKSPEEQLQLLDGLSLLQQDEPAKSDSGTFWRSMFEVSPDVSAEQELHDSDDRPAKRIRRSDEASTSGVNDGTDHDPCDG
ncbi:unnamed protein product [Microthlaspi erraticum]|uniref:CW-type domain-containing protein n=1 Tax=Microthlaspi erraticum TaxID=1685480 RepID=A0A6D2HPR5_9BRAS|nr:unnamed protein product [Microthlaspi erraticum]